MGFQTGSSVSSVFRYFGGSERAWCWTCCRLHRRDAWCRPSLGTGLTSAGISIYGSYRWSALLYSARNDDHSTIGAEMLGSRVEARRSQSGKRFLHCGFTVGRRCSIPPPTPVAATRYSGRPPRGLHRQPGPRYLGANPGDGPVRNDEIPMSPHTGNLVIESTPAEWKLHVARVLYLIVEGTERRLPYCSQKGSLAAIRRAYSVVT